MLKSKLYGLFPSPFHAPLEFVALIFARSPVDGCLKAFYSIWDPINIRLRYATWKIKSRSDFEEPNLWRLASIEGFSPPQLCSQRWTCHSNSSRKIGGWLELPLIWGSDVIGRRNSFEQFESSFNALCLLWFYWQQILCVHWTDEWRRGWGRLDVGDKARFQTFAVRSMGYLGICSAISSKLSLGFIGVFSNSLDGAVRCVLKSERLTRLNTFAPRRCRNSIFFFFLFASSRCKLWRRKKNIDILHVTRLDLQTKAGTRRNKNWFINKIELSNNKFKWCLKGICIMSNGRREKAKIE